MTGSTVKRVGQDRQTGQRGCGMAEEDGRPVCTAFPVGRCEGECSTFLAAESQGGSFQSLKLPRKEFEAIWILASSPRQPGRGQEGMASRWTKGEVQVFVTISGSVQEMTGHGT